MTHVLRYLTCDDCVRMKKDCGSKNCVARPEYAILERKMIIVGLDRIPNTNDEVENHIMALKKSTKSSSSCYSQQHDDVRW